MAYSPIFAFILALLITLTMVPLLIRLAQRYSLVDKPGGRKTHSAAVPRIGGVAMAAAASTSIFLWADLTPVLKSILVGLAILCFTGLLDDLLSVKWWKKLLAQGIAASIVVIYGGAEISSIGYWWGVNVVLPHWFSIPATIIFIMGVTNAINLSDGLDGLAAGITIFIMAFLIFLAKINDVPSCYVPLASILGAIWGFLRFNTHPAVIFMGDTGSYFLGFSVAVFTILVTQHSGTAVSPLIILFVLGLPIIDTFAVILERLASGAPVFKPDQRHFHYRLVHLGFSHKEAVIIIYAIQAFCLYMALMLLFYPASTITGIFLVIALMISGSFYAAYRSRWKYRGQWWLDNLLKTFMGSKVRMLFERVPLFILTFLLSAFLLGAPLFSKASQPGTTAQAVILFFPILLGVSYLVDNEIIKTISRICIYYLLAFLSLNLLNGSTSSTRFLGFSSWFVAYFAILVASTMFYIKFASPESFVITPVDFLILLLAAAVPFIPANFSGFSGNFSPLILSIIFFSFAVEAVMSYGRMEERILIGSSIISSTLLGIKYLISL